MVEYGGGVSTAAATGGGRRRGRWIGATAGLLVLLLVGGFFGYGWWSRRGDVEYSRGGAAFLDAQGLEAERLAGAPPPVSARDVPASEQAPPPPSAADRLPAPTLAPTLPSPAASGAATAAPRPSTAGTAKPAEQPAKPVPSAPVAAAVRRPVSGVYTLEVKGREGVKFGPLSFCDRTLPTETSMVVAPAEGEPDGSYAFDLRYYPGQAGQHDERQILRYDENSIAMTYEVGTVTCSGVRQSSEVSYEPSVDRVRFPLKVGAKWSGRSGNDRRTETYTTTISRRDVVEIAGTKYPVYVIESDATFTGAENGERKRVWWFSPERGMPLKWTDFIKGGRSGASFTNDVGVEVTDLPKAPAPAREKPALEPVVLTGSEVRQRPLR
ncbi:MAG: hypothetical protein ACT4QF_13270 [Sporichthyaceae bacterium]